ncbi:MAG: CHC2 zinc finger domain-containing protein [Gammaproteobacteria bacterium]|nr:CHC2 zinc finger domain-containing protein [Gammaproteobacteria bacterium]
MIPRDFIDELLDRTDIVDVVQSRVTIKKQGKN